MKMKYLAGAFCAAVVLTGFGQLSYGQDTPEMSGTSTTAPGEHGKRGEKMEELFAKLNLTPEQKEKVKTAFETRRQAVKAAEGDPKGKMEAIKTFRETMKSILTPDQLKIWEENMHGHGGKHGGDGGSPAPVTTGS